MLTLVDMCMHACACSPDTKDDDDSGVEGGIPQAEPALELHARLLSASFCA